MEKQRHRRPNRTHVQSVPEVLREVESLLCEIVAKENPVLWRNELLKLSLELRRLARKLERALADLDEGPGQVGQDSLPF